MLLIIYSEQYNAVNYTVQYIVITVHSLLSMELNHMIIANNSENRLKEDFYYFHTYNNDLINS